MENFEEKRECERYRCRQDKDAYVAVRPKFERIGALNDVGAKGLAFTYTLMEDYKTLSSEATLVSIDLFLSENQFYLPGLRCEVAYDTVVEGSLVPDMHLRRCGVKFCELTAMQKDQIRHFLDQYTTCKYNDQEM